MNIFDWAYWLPTLLAAALLFYSATQSVKIPMAAAAAALGALGPCLSLVLLLASVGLKTRDAQYFLVSLIVAAPHVFVLIPLGLIAARHVLRRTPANPRLTVACFGIAFLGYLWTRQVLHAL